MCESTVEFFDDTLKFEVYLVRTTELNLIGATSHFSES